MRTAQFGFARKKPLKKTLIPLPPTGIASLFCAKARAVQTPAPPRPAAGSEGVVAIAHNAKSCKKVQMRCTALRSVDEMVRGVRRPACRRCSLENLPDRAFSFSELFESTASPAPLSPLAKMAVRPALLGSRIFCGTAQRLQEFPSYTVPFCMTRKT